MISLLIIVMLMMTELGEWEGDNVEQRSNNNCIYYNALYEEYFRRKRIFTCGSCSSYS